MVGNQRAILVKTNDDLYFSLQSIFCLKLCHSFNKDKLSIGAKQWTIKKRARQTNSQQGELKYTIRLTN